ncbi:MAG: DUF11 domain-containing protein [Anaerolineae bacterium]|jgi:uncharacterized repeat protein (TIGR01451 family)|nr:DUF11 domain-containing protein [Anaerolineae bacterium]
MTPMQWRGSRRSILGLMTLVTLAVLGLVLGLAQAARADIASLDGSTKTASPDRVLPGNQLTYTIVVSNAGAAVLSPITVLDQLPPEVFYVGNSTPGGAGFSIDPTQRQVTWTIPVMSANSKMTLGLTVQAYDGVVPGSAFTNTAVISDGITTIEPSAMVTIETAKYTYFPIMMRRWPPVPYAPVLNPIGVAGDDLTVSWTYGGGVPAVPDPDYYHLQRASDPAFTDIRENYEPVSNPTSLPNVPGGTWYFRVRGHNSYGYGEWSNVVAVTLGYADDFSNNTSGWPRTVYQWYGRNAFDVAYENGSYRAKILLNKDGLLNRIMGSVAAPWVNPYTAYDVEVKHWFAEAGDQGGILPTAGKGGLIFGANADFTTIYVIEWNFEGNCSVNKYPGRSAPVSSSAIPRTIFRDWGRCASVKTGYNQVNTARVTVNGNAATVYINGTEIVSFTDSQLGSMHRVGILTGSWDRTPVEGRFDDFRVTSR